MLYSLTMRNLITLLIIALLSLYAHASGTLEQVVVRLDWKYQFQHAGLIVAKEKGYYKDVGLEVELLEYQEGVGIAKEVLAGRADFGIANTSLIYNNNGLLEPIVLVATYLQKSPLVFVTQPNITHPSQLNGKTIMITDYEAKNSSLSLLLEHFFIKSTNVAHSFGVEEFKQKKVDAMSAFVSNELYHLDKENIPYNIIDPEEYGFVTNAMNLFTSYSYAVKNPKRVQRFLDATNKGWKYALEHTDEVLRLIQKKYRPSKSIEELNYEAKKIKELMLVDLFDIGESNKELMHRSYKQLVRSEKLKAGQESKILIFGDILEETQDTNFILNEQEKAYLKEKGALKLCVDPDWMPYESIKNGKHIGIVADYFDIFRKKFGLKIELKPTKSWAQSIEAMKQRECDILSAATPTPERLKYMDFTDLYIKPSFVIATTMDKPFVANIEDIQDEKLGISKEYAIAGILREKYKSINIIDVQSVHDGLRKVESGELYGYIDNLSVIAHAIQKDFSGSIKITARIDEIDGNAIGSRNDEPLLNSIFQKAVKHITEAQKQTILNNWISVKESVSINNSLVIKIALFVFLCFVIFFMYNLQLRNYNKKLEKLSRIDTLTEINNRLKLDEILEEQEKFTARYKSTCGVILLDIDDFKKVNDTYGHLTGDEVLKEFAIILKNSIRESDTVGRWGGEEFLIICPNTPLENLKILAENLRENIQMTTFSKGLHISSSFGLSSIDNTKNSDKALDEVDKALYLAKSKGKNRVEIFTL